MANYDCVVGLNIQVVSEATRQVSIEGEIGKVHPVKGRRANGYEVLIGTRVYFIFLDRIDMGRLMKIEEGRTVSILNRPDMLTYKFTKVAKVK